MHLPELLPEELLFGYEGRLRTLNYMPESLSIVSALNRLQPRRSSAPGLQMSFVEMVAEAHGRNVFDIVMNHTLWPYTAAASRPTDRASIETFVVSRAGRTAVGRSARRGAWLCKECVREDLEFWHQSYWRRNHQLPGVFWCDKHGSPLARVASPAMALGEPHHFESQAHVNEQIDVLALGRNRLVATFTQASVELLEATGVVDLATTTRRIRDRADMLGDDAVLTLSSLARDCAALPWLEDVFPRINWREDGRLHMMSVICQELPGKPSTASTLFAASLVSSSADDALALLITRNSNSPHKNRASASKLRNNTYHARLPAGV